MPTTNAGGIDIRQTGTRIILRVLLQDSSGAIITTGTASLRLYELQNDDTFLSYDFNSNTFKSTALTTETASMTHRTGNNGTTNTGIWTYGIGTVSAFNTKSVYVAVVDHSSASPVRQAREFQYGSGEGDLVVSTTGLASANLGAILNTAITETSAGRNAAALTKLLDVATPVFTCASVNQTGDLYGAMITASGTIQAVSGGNITLQTAIGSDNALTGQNLLITSGAGKGQVRRCGGYVNSTKVLTLDTGFSTAPSVGDSYVIFAITTPWFATSLSAYAQANIVAAKGTTINESVAGQIAGGFSKFFDTPSPTSTMNRITLVDTVTSVTNSVTAGTVSDKTGYALTAGEHTNIATDTQTGLTAQGYTSARATKVDNLDATVSSRMATYTQPTGFLASTFPTTVASPTNITGGTITTVTSVTNAVNTNANATETAIKAQTDKLLFDVSNNVKSTPQTSVNLGSILGTSLTETVAGYLAAAFKQFFNVASPTSTMNRITLVDTVTSCNSVNYISALNPAGGRTAAAGSSTTITSPVAYGANDIIKFMEIVTFAGTGPYQSRTITAYNNSTKVITVDRPWDITPDNTTQYYLIAGTKPTVNSDGSVITAANATETATAAAVAALPNATANATAAAAAILATPAYKLATNSDGSVNAEVDDAGIATAVATALSGSTITLKSPVSSDGSALTLLRGDSYTASRGNSLTYSITNQTGLIGTVPHIRIFGVAGDLAVASAIASGTQTITFSDITAATTTALLPGARPYQIRFMSGSDVVTVVDGTVTVKDGL